MSRGNQDLPRGDRDDEDEPAAAPVNDFTPALPVSKPNPDEDFFAYLDRLAKELHLTGENES